MARLDIDVSNPDTYVVCPECQQKMRTLSVSHTRLHGKTPSELCVKFPGTKIYCKLAEVVRREANIINGAKGSAIYSNSLELHKKAVLNRASGISRYWNKPENIEKARERALARISDHGSRFGGKWTDEERAALSKRSVERVKNANDPWLRSITRDSRSKGGRNSIGNLLSRRGPNSVEICIAEMFDGILEFVGDGKLWLTSCGKHMNPDFVVIGKRRVVEFFGDYWHPGGEAEANARIQLFRDIGWDCLVVSEREWNINLNRSCESILKFAA